MPDLLLELSCIFTLPLRGRVAAKLRGGVKGIAWPFAYAQGVRCFRMSTGHAHALCAPRLTPLRGRVAAKLRGGVKGIAWPFAYAQGVRCFRMSTGHAHALCAPRLTPLRGEGRSEAAGWGGMRNLSTFHKATALRLRRNR